MARIGVAAKLNIVKFFLQSIGIGVAAEATGLAERLPAKYQKHTFLARILIV